MPWLFVILLLTLLISDLAWWRWADRRVRHSRVARALLALFMALQLLGLFYFLLPGRHWTEHPLPGTWLLLAATFMWHLLFVPILLVLLVSGGLLSLLLRIFPRPPISETNPAPPSPLSRRQFMGAALALTPPLLASSALVRAASQVDTFRIRRLELPIADLPADLDALTITHLSDIHVGDFTPARMLNKIVDHANRLRSDLVLITGDLINRSLSELPAGIDLVRRLDPRLGLAMCEGNHDLFESRLLFDLRVQQAGIPLLIDQAMTVSLRGCRVQLLGMQWGPARSGGVSVMPGSIQKLSALRDPDAFPILLAHHPHAFDYAAMHGFPLTLCGHTHGGQLMLSPHLGFGPAMYRYWSGHYQNGRSHVVVSNGVGNWFPLRINAPAEIIHLTLRRHPR